LTVSEEPIPLLARSNGRDASMALRDQVGRHAGTKGSSSRSQCRLDQPHVRQGRGIAPGRTVRLPLHDLWELRRRQRLEQQAKEFPKRQADAASSEVVPLQGFGCVKDVGNAQGQSEAILAAKEIVPYVSYRDERLQSWVMRAAVVLGYMHFDGEGGGGTSSTGSGSGGWGGPDRGSACRLLKLAVLAGSREAARALLWMHATGQF
jgi:hypothetical protein